MNADEFLKEIIDITKETRWFFSGDHRKRLFALANKIRQEAIEQYQSIQIEEW
jgi:hypothetical protein